VANTGLGLVSGPTAVAVQSVVGWERRGAVTIPTSSAVGWPVQWGCGDLRRDRQHPLSARLSNAPQSVAKRLGRTTDATSLVLGGHLDPASPVVRFVRTALYDASSTYSSLWRSSRSS
jgi:hypothetical protein